MGIDQNSPGPFKAEFMRSKNRKLRSFNKDRTTYITLRFKGDFGQPTWMTIVMPRPGAELEAHQIDFNKIDWSSFKRKEAHLVMPKFNIENELDLVDFMNSKGASRLFSEKTAD